MTGERRRSPAVLLYGSRRPLDQFAGVPERLNARGAEVLYERLWTGPDVRAGRHAPTWLIERAGVVGFADLSDNLHTRPVRIAQRLGVPTALLVDGVVEFANVAMNPWLGRRYLRPAAQDVLACLGPLQGAILRAMGNPVVETGLPRLDGFRDRVEAARDRTPGGAWLAVATANTPSLSEPARRRVLSAMEALRDEAARHGVAARWRLSGGLCEELGVEADRAPLDETLAGAWGVVTTASTLGVEAMLASVPTCVLHPHPWPLWVPGAWEWRPVFEDQNGDAEEVGRALGATGAVRARADEVIGRLTGGRSVVAGLRGDPREQAGTVLEALRTPDAWRIEMQRTILASMDTPRAADRVSELLKTIADGGVRAAGVTPRPAVVGPEAIGRVEIAAPPKRRRRVVSLVQCGGSPVGGVTNWSLRLGQAFAARPDLGYEFHTVLVAAEPLNYENANIPEDSADLARHACVLEPTAGTHERVDAIRRAVEALEPDVVIPSYNDETFAVAAQVHATGRRVLAVGHVDADADARRLASFDRWDAGVAVSAACMEWMAPVAGERPLSQIVYGVPVRQEPRRSDRTRPLQVGYLGRVVEWQKRVSDLVALLGHLERLGADYEFHVVGDGPDLKPWTRRVGAMGLLGTRVRLHGRRPMEWVEDFLPRLDLSVLVSEWEGTSVSMLEAMGAGVVPCVTAVRSGVSEWVEDGVHGVVVPVGAPGVMAERIAALARDRDLVDRLGAAAHARLVERRMSTKDMATRYAAVFDAVLARPRAFQGPTDLGVRMTDRFGWSVPAPDSPDEADRWIREGLHEAGYGSIAEGAPAAGADAVLIRAADPRPDPREVERWRAKGLGVGVSPNLAVEAARRMAEVVVRRLIESGRRRIAVFGAGHQSLAFTALVGAGAPIIGFLDDSVDGFTTHQGLPVRRFDDAQELGVDAVVLNSQRFEPLMALRCERLRRAGVAVAAMVRSDEELAARVAGLKRASEAIGAGRRVLVVVDPGLEGYASAVSEGRPVRVVSSEGLAAIGREDPPEVVALAVEEGTDVTAALGAWRASGAEIIPLVSALEGGADHPDD